MIWYWNSITKYKKRNSFNWGSSYRKSSKRFFKAIRRRDHWWQKYRQTETHRDHNILMSCGDHTNTISYGLHEYITTRVSSADAVPKQVLMCLKRGHFQTPGPYVGPWHLGLNMGKMYIDTARGEMKCHINFFKRKKQSNRPNIKSWILEMNLPYSSSICRCLYPGSEYG